MVSFIRGGRAQKYEHGKVLFRRQPYTIALAASWTLKGRWTLYETVMGLHKEWI